METLFPGDSDVDDNIGVLDVVYDGLVRYDPETTEPYNYVAGVDRADRQHGLDDQDQAGPDVPER